MNIVLVNGWSAPSVLWSDFCVELVRRLSAEFDAVDKLEIIDLNASRSIEQWCQLIASKLNEHSLLIGWSLGAMLATETLRTLRCKAKGFVSLMANSSFVANAHCTWAMPSAQYQAFYQHLAQDPTLALRSFRALLVEGEQAPRKVLRHLNEAYSAGQISPEILEQTLAHLASLDLADSYADLALPGLYIWGERDALAGCPDHGQRENLRQLNPGHRFEYLAAASHLPMFSASELIITHISSYLGDLRATTNKGLAGVVDD